MDLIAERKKTHKYTAKWSPRGKIQAAFEMQSEKSSSLCPLRIITLTVSAAQSDSC